MKNSFRVSWILRRSLPLVAVLFLPTLVQAHPGLPGHTHGFANGLAHPLAGLDHILAMVAVGLWAAQRGGRALWAVPLTFVSVMALGGMLGLAARRRDARQPVRYVGGAIAVCGLCLCSGA